jgi:hypothetical protein
MLLSGSTSSIRWHASDTYNKRRCIPPSSSHRVEKVLLLCSVVLVVSLLLSSVFYTTTTIIIIPLEKEMIAFNYYPYNDSPIHLQVADNETLLLNPHQHQRREHDESEVYESPSCLVHRPITAKFDHVKNNENMNQSRLAAIIHQPSAAQCGRLRRDWTGGRHRQQQQQQQQQQKQPSLYSDLAREMEAHQSNCSLPTMYFNVDNDYGLGSHLVLWSQALCNAWEANHRIRTVNPEWLWRDRTYCSQQRQAARDESPLSCYFPKVENRCPQDRRSQQQSQQQQQAVNVTDPRNRNTFCKRIREAAHDDRETVLREFRRASMEYIFQQVSPLVIAEAERQLGLLFHNNRGTVPGNLIAVHIRWGDKFWEMDLAPIPEYLDAIEQLLQLQQGSSSNTYSTGNETVHIYLATEDPRAVQEFLHQAPAHYKVYVDRTVAELNAYRPAKGNRASWTSRNTQGRAGLVALGSLLVALEAQAYVLTTQSNWSRLMDALRRNVIDAQCGNCTRMIDLRPGDW